MWTPRSALLLLFRVAVLFCTANGGCEGFVQLDKFVEEVMDCKGIPGLALAVVYGADTETRWYGLRDVRHNLPVDRHTLFPIGSLTKAFTSALVAHVLGDRDNVSWDTPVRKILGDTFEMPDRFQTHDLCLRDILAHKVGLEEYTPFQLMGLNLTGEQLESRVRHFDERLPFRSEFSYSNLMYGLAGHVLERLTNDTWADALRKRLTGPLGMADTHTARAVLEEGEGRGNLAQGYLVDPLQGASLALDQEQLRAVTDAGVSAGGVVSTTGDMARWMRFHLKGGKTPEGVRLVRKRLLQETHAPQMAITSGTFPREGRYRPDSAVDDTVPAYSMGWVTGTYRGYRRLVHGGTLASYNSLLTLFPSENIGIFTASNGVAQFQSDVHWSIHNYISDFGLGEIPWLNSSTICQQRHRRHAGSHAGKTVLLVAILP
ncbi:PREDICTED: gigasin-6-like [Branchiostoma belcheri]|uniref:Gigasin-6-like n=1 Tax=Branchiostoma belcheri TaxID=7741 RepID=A0A6P4ZFM6_BRABE|nr:PREDICTED: gigasin-6-like [Branchiostoma belcheri]